MSVPFMMLSTHSGGILDRKAANVHVANVPEDKGHRAPDLGYGVLGVVPCVAVAVDTAGVVAIDGDVGARG